MPDSKSEPLLDTPKAVVRDGASVSGAIVSLVKVCVGSGVMALPWATVQGGALSLPGLAALVAWNFYTSWQLLACREAQRLVQASSEATRSAYSALAFAALGYPGLWALEGSLVVVLLGACAGLQIQAAELLDATVPAIGYGSWVLGGALLLAPLVLQRTLAGVAIIALSGLVVLCIGLTAVAANGLVEYGAPHPSAELLSLPSPAGFASFFGIAAFAFGGTQATILPVQDGMASPERAVGALATALLIAGGLYALVGLALASLYEHAEGGVQPLIILNLVGEHPPIPSPCLVCVPSHSIPSHPIPSHPHPIPSHPIPSRAVPLHPVLCHPVPYCLVPSRPIPSRTHPTSPKSIPTASYPYPILFDSLVTQSSASQSTGATPLSPCSPTHCR